MNPEPLDKIYQAQIELQEAKELDVPGGVYKNKAKLLMERPEITVHIKISRIQRMRLTLLIWKAEFKYWLKGLFERVIEWII